MNRCLVCDGAYVQSRLPGLLQCRSCRFVSADVALSPEKLKQLYTNQYFKGEEYRDYLADRAILQKHFRQRLRKLLQFVPNPKQKNLLEIGCAYGFFLSTAADSFASVEGIDIATDAVRYAREQLHQQAFDMDLLDYRPKHPIDVICMWDTVEHLGRPADYINAAARSLSPGGVIAITTGDVESIVARLRGRHWRQIHPPTHLHYFSKRTLSRLLERNGLEICYAGHDGQYRSMESMAYGLLMVKNNHPASYHFLQRSKLLNWALYLNLFDIMYLIARKVK